MVSCRGGPCWLQVPRDTVFSAPWDAQGVRAVSLDPAPSLTCPVASIRMSYPQPSSLSFPSVKTTQSSTCCSGLEGSEMTSEWGLPQAAHQLLEAQQPVDLALNLSLVLPSLCETGEEILASQV